MRYPKEKKNKQTRGAKLTLTSTKYIHNAKEGGFKNSSVPTRFPFVRDGDVGDCAITVRVSSWLVM